MRDYEIYDLEEQERLDSLKDSGEDISSTWEMVLGAILLFLFLPAFVFLGLLL